MALVLTACSTAPFTISASGPFPYPANYAYPTNVDSTVERVAVVVTITNQSGDDLQVNPADFVVRDGQRRIYPSNPVATSASSSLANRPPALRGILPMSTVTLRSNDVLSGYVLFDLPTGTRPVELIWRQSDTDSVVALSAAH